MQLKVLENKLKVVKMKKDNEVPKIVFNQNFYSITKTDDELSIVLDEDVNIQTDIVEYNWRAIKIILLKADKLEDAINVLKQNEYQVL